MKTHGEMRQILPEKHYTETEAADCLGLSKKTMQAWRIRGCGPRFVKMGRAVRYPASALVEYQASLSVQQSTSETAA
ncbi:MAG: helix-turn-helix transcriptional regulator [Methylomicrobium sp.]